MVALMVSSADLEGLPRRELADLLRGGYAVAPEALAGYEYRGVSLGLPRWVERLSWKTFVKVFHQDTAAGAVRGWNVRIVQGPVAYDYAPVQRGGAPLCFGHFQVRPLEPGRDRGGSRAGVLLDYGRGGNARLDPTRWLRDPVVALEGGSARLLLGWTYVALPGLRLSTPSFFSLERGGPASHVARPPRSQSQEG